jgi:hypothetical protein
MHSSTAFPFQLCLDNGKGALMATMYDQCFLCGHGAEYSKSGRTKTFTCLNCGMYELTRDAQAFLPSALSSEFAPQRSIISGYVREWSDNPIHEGIPLQLTVNILREILQSPEIPTNISQQLDKLLLHIYWQTHHLGQEVPVILQQPAVGYASSEDELRSLYEGLTRLQYIEAKLTICGGIGGIDRDVIFRGAFDRPGFLKACRLTIEGMQRVEQFIVAEVTPTHPGMQHLVFQGPVSQVNIAQDNATIITTADPTPPLCMTQAGGQGSINYQAGRDIHIRREEDDA